MSVPPFPFYAIDVKPGGKKMRFARIRRKGIVATPADLGIDSKMATPSLDDLVSISKGLYRPPRSVRS